MRSKQPFIKCQSAVAVVANRYDGIDLIEDDCRLLMADSLPGSANLQERFFVLRVLKMTVEGRENMEHIVPSGPIQLQPERHAPKVQGFLEALEFNKNHVIRAWMLILVLAVSHGSRPSSIVKSRVLYFFLH